MHLAFVDVMMPELNGTEFIKRVNEIDSDIAVVVMSGYGTVDIAVEAMKLGAHDFIAKPAAIENFAMAARIALERRQLRIENRTHQEKVERKLADSDLKFDHMHRDLEDSILQTIKLFSGFLDNGPRSWGTTRKGSLRPAGKYAAIRPPRQHPERYQTAACSHDIGKIVIPDALLAKTGISS